MTDTPMTSAPLVLELALGEAEADELAELAILDAILDPAAEEEAAAELALLEIELAALVALLMAEPSELAALLLALLAELVALAAAAAGFEKPLSSLA